MQFDQPTFLPAPVRPARRVPGLVAVLALGLLLVSGVMVAQAANPAQDAVNAPPAAKQLPPPLPSSVPTLPPPVSTAQPTPCVVRFADVPGDSLYMPYVRCLVCHGIMNGYTCGGYGEPCNPANDPYFRPNNNMTRGQMAKVITNAARFADAIPADRQTFSDVPHDNPFWVYVERAASHGIISGYSGQPTCPTPGMCFLPNNNITRAQAAKLVANAAGFSDTIPSSRWTFDDVPQTSPFWVYVERVALHGVISGYQGDGERLNPCTNETEQPLKYYFHPCSPVTRGQTAKFVANAFYPACETP